MITLIKLQALFRKIAPKGMTQVFADWHMMVGLVGRSRLQPIKIVGGVEAILTHVSPRHVVVETLVEQDEAALGAIYFAFPDDLVIEIIAEVLMMSEEAKLEKVRSGLSDNDVETFQEMANLLCGSWNRVFQDSESNLRISQSVDALQVSPTVGKRQALVQQMPEGRVAAIEMEITLADKTFPSLIALPFPSAIAVAEGFYAAEAAQGEGSR